MEWIDNACKEIALPGDISFSIIISFGDIDLYKTGNALQNGNQTVVCKMLEGYII